MQTESAQLGPHVRGACRAIGAPSRSKCVCRGACAPLRRTHRQVHGTSRGNRSRRVRRPNHAHSIASLVKHVINVVFSTRSGVSTNSTVGFRPYKPSKNCEYDSHPASPSVDNSVASLIHRSLMFFRCACRRVWKEASVFCSGFMPETTRIRESRPVAARILQMSDLP